MSANDAPMFWEVVWSVSDYECDRETVLGRFADEADADALAARIGACDQLYVRGPDSIVTPGPSPKWCVRRNQNGDGAYPVMPTGDESYRQPDPANEQSAGYFGEWWEAEVYAATKDEAIQKFNDHFGLVYTGEAKGFSKVMQDWAAALSDRETPYVAWVNKTYASFGLKSATPDKETP